jgi:chemotaxis protein MotB
MFAFFVVMFATSQADQAKTKAVADSVSKALQEDKFAAQVMNVVGKKSGRPSQKAGIDLTSVTIVKPDQQKHVELTPSLKQLTHELEEDIKSGRMKIELVPRGLVISLKEGAFFKPGQADVNEERYGSVGKLAKVIQRLPNPVRLEGHTDSQPISNSRFRSNWELSAARSIAVLELLRDRYQLEQSRMAIVGYADTLAMDTNMTDEGRARNRRVDITILNEETSSGDTKSPGGLTKGT